jgi:hypothetical protein
VKVEARVDGRAVQMTIRELRQIEPHLTRKLQQRLQVGLGDVVAKIQAEIPKAPPIQGRDGRPSMSHRGRTRWKGANKPQVKFYGGGMRGKYSNLVVIEVTGGASLGFDYAELAGIRPRSARSNRSRTYTRRGSSGPISHAVTTQGDEFIAALERAKPIPGKAGRFAYDAFLRSRVQIIGKTVQILDDFMDDYNKKFDVRMWGM